MSDSSGHRQRVKDRFRQEGLEHFHEIHVLELLLFYCIPRVDTKPLARRLIDHFGSLAQVLEAAPAELERVEGIGSNVSTYLSLITQVGRYYLSSRLSNTTVLDSADKYGAYLVSRFFGQRNEVVYLLCLDAKCKVLCCKKIAEGSVNSAGVSPRKVVEVALGVNATTVILAHNHTSGLALPSTEDIVTTRQIARALNTVEITLADHIVVADNDFVSLVQSGLYVPDTLQTFV